MKKKITKIAICFAIIIIFVVRIFFFDYIVVSGSSMFPNFRDGEVLLIEKQYENINRFDVVVCTTQRRGFDYKVLKRIIGIPHDTVQIIDGYVYINGEKLDDIVNVEIEFAGIAEDKITLEDNQYFILGDNRNASEDSRSEWLGIVEEEQIVGKVVGKILKK